MVQAWTHPCSSSESSQFSTEVRVQDSLIPAAGKLPRLCSATRMDSAPPSWTSTSLCTRSGHRVYCPQCCMEGNKRKRLHGKKESDCRSTCWIGRDSEVWDPIRMQEVRSPSRHLKMTGTLGTSWSLFCQKKWKSYTSCTRSSADQWYQEIQIILLLGRRNSIYSISQLFLEGSEKSQPKVTTTIC